MTALRPATWAIPWALLAACGSSAGRWDRARPLVGAVDTVIAVPMGRPFGAAVSDRGLAYVTLHSSVGALASWDFGERTAAPLAVLTGAEPTNVAFAPGGRIAYVASQWSSGVDVVRVSTARVDTLWDTPANDPFQLAVSADGQRVVVGGNAGRLFVLDARHGVPVATIPVGPAPNGIVLSRDGAWAYLTDLRDSAVGVVDLRTGAYRALALMDGAVGQGIALSGDERSVYAVSQDAGRLYRFDATTGARLAAVPAGDRPFGLALTPDRREVWVTTLGGELLRFRLPDLALVARLDLGGELRRIAFDPRGRGAVVADESGRVIVLR